MIKKYDFHKTKYGSELLVDLIRLETLEKYINSDRSHFLTYYDITLIQDGQGSLLLDNNVVNIQKNRIICSSPMQIRQWKINAMPKGLVLIFEDEFLSTFFNDAEFVKRLNFFHTIATEPILSLTDSKNSYIENLLLNIEKEILHFNNRNKHILRALLYQALAWLDREYTKHKNINTVADNNNTVLRFKNLVSEFYTQKHSVNFYAEKLNISPGYLNDLIKREINISAKQFIQNRVILEAKRLLRNTPLSISEIAWKLNFNDVSYFIRAFKNKTGLTPKLYRNIKDS